MVRRPAIVVSLRLCCVVGCARPLAQAPANDGCSAPTAVFDGVDPAPPSGAAGATFTNVGATNAAGFGDAPSLTEIVPQAASGVPPFVNLLDADGNSTIGPVLGAPPITPYGVSLARNAFGQIGEAAPPVAFAIP